MIVFKKKKKFYVYLFVKKFFFKKVKISFTSLQALLPQLLWPDRDEFCKVDREPEETGSDPVSGT